MSDGGGAGPRLDRIQASAYTIPTEAPQSDGTLEWSATTLVLVEAHAGGHRGIGYTYADTAAAVLVRDALAPMIDGCDAFDVNAAWLAMIRGIRNIGRPGLASMAVAAVDVALWDLKARLLQIPVALLLGRVRDGVPVYASGGFTSMSIPELRDDIEHYVARGMRAVKIKVGREPDKDPDRVHAARAALGPSRELFVDANGAYRRQQALALAVRFAEANVTWFEEPVSSDDLRGLRWLRRRMPPGMEIAAGEYGGDPVYFRRMLEADAVDVLMPDATRCGGITGFLEAGALCAAFGVPMSAHTAPALHLHACCAVRAVRHLEWFHDHARIERMLFDGLAEPVDSVLYPDLGRPGIGIEFKWRDAARYAA